MRRLTRWKLALVALGVSVALLAAAAAYQGSAHGLRARKGSLVAVTDRHLGERNGSTLWETTLRTSSGLEVHAYARRTGEAQGRRPGIVLVGGVKRGGRVVSVAGLDPIARAALIVSPDYPLRLNRNAWQGLRGVATLLRLRPAALDAVASTLLLVDYLESRPEVDPRRIVLVGGSLGAEIVTIAGGVDPRPAAVVALYGAANLGPLVAHTLAHPARRSPAAPWQATLAGHGLAWLLAPLDPARYAGAIAPRPFLMVNGDDDSLVPRRHAQALYDAARAPKHLVWVRSEHVQPDEAALIASVSETVRAWLAGRGLLGD